MTALKKRIPIESEQKRSSRGFSYVAAIHLPADKARNNKKGFRSEEITRMSFYTEEMNVFRCRNRAEDTSRLQIVLVRQITATNNIFSILSHLCAEPYIPPKEGLKYKNFMQVQIVIMRVQLEKPHDCRP